MHCERLWITTPSAGELWSVATSRNWHSISSFLIAQNDTWAAGAVLCGKVLGFFLLVTQHR
jgi:hypothetical protein